jgi:hypothetical protein
MHPFCEVISSGDKKDLNPLVAVGEAYPQCKAPLDERAMENYELQVMYKIDDNTVVALTAG